MHNVFIYLLKSYILREAMFVITVRAQWAFLSPIINLYWGISEGCNSFGCIIEARTKNNMLFLWWQVHGVDHEDVLAEHIQQQTKWDHSRVEHTWLNLLMQGSPYKAIAFLKQPSTIPQTSTSRKAFPFISIWDLEN